jgi:hypothetical protein
MTLTNGGSRSAAAALEGSGYEEAIKRETRSWRKMSSAPRDGTIILAKGPDYGKSRGRLHYALVRFDRSKFVSIHTHSSFDYLDGWVAVRKIASSPQVSSARRPESTEGLKVTLSDFINHARAFPSGAYRSEAALRAWNEVLQSIADRAEMQL